MSGAKKRKKLERYRLPPERKGITRKTTIGSKDVYWTPNEYDDGQLGEIFISIGKEGSQLRVYDCIATMISINLQYGIPLGILIEKMRDQQMEPSGITSDPDVPIAKSVMDYIGRKLDLMYDFNGYRRKGNK